MDPWVRRLRRTHRPTTDPPAEAAKTLPSRSPFELPTSHFRLPRGYFAPFQPACLTTADRRCPARVEPARLVVSRFPAVPLLLLGLGSAVAHAQTPDLAPKVAVVSPAEGTIRLDGRLDEEAWQDATFITDFRQKEPVQFADPSVPTAVAFLYDDEALYIGARLGREDASFPQSLSRRDQYANAEHLVISIDSHLDHRTAYSFVVTAGGTRIDYFHTRDSDSFGARDFTWNPVWEAEVVTDSAGWTVEFRIPFSQLRFNPADRQTWGLNINRWVPDRNEDIFWVVVPREETGFSSRFGTLEGLRDLRRSRRIELLPYVATDGTFDGTVSSEDPFNDGSRTGLRAGGEVRMGLGPGLTLDASINPDFGQVEADPAELNLSAFETFFSERRPFFTEGSQLLPSGSVFFTRRIGAPPRGPADGAFVDRPANTTILGAAKVTGQLPSGLSIGVLAALTDRTHARVMDTTGSPVHRVEVEPLAYYGAARLQQQFGANASTVGVSLAGMQREFSPESDLESLLSRRALAAIADSRLRFRNGEYELRFTAGMSRVEGDSAAIQRIQRAPAHFFQRPDADRPRLDSTLTVLTGYTASLRADKNAGNWLWGAGVTTESPGYETNDMGRVTSVDDVDLNWDVNYRETTPGPLFRTWNLGVSHSISWNYDGDRGNTRASVFSSATLRNFWTAGLTVWLRPRGLSDSQTRGGPLMQTLRSWGMDVRLGTNQNSTNSAQGSFSWSRSEEGGWSVSLNPRVSLRPGPRLSASLNPRLSRSVNPRQFIGTETRSGSETFGTRYLFGRIDQTVLSMQLRLNYAVSPDLTLELYAEPFTASGSFRDLGELALARTPDLRRFDTEGLTTITNSDGSLAVADERDGDSFFIPGLDFNRFSFRSNLVARWEWTPGSTLFLVWQQDRFDQCTPATLSACPADTRPGDVPSAPHLLNAFRAEGKHVLALKASYWIPVR